MENYISKRSGEEVDAILDDVANKVDKVKGKGLSTEDFTTDLKNKVETTTDIVASQIFLEFIADRGDGTLMFNNKQGYEEHNREVCKRIIKNFGRTPNDEIFFVTINGVRNGVPYMETAILESNNGAFVKATFVKGYLGEDSSAAAQLSTISINASVLSDYAYGEESDFWWRYTSKDIPSVDDIGTGNESDVYVTEFTLEQITKNGTTVTASRAFVDAVYSKKIILVPYRNTYVVAYSAYAEIPEKTTYVDLRFFFAGIDYISTLSGSIIPAGGTGAIQVRVRTTTYISDTLSSINGISLLSGNNILLAGSIVVNGNTFTPDAKGVVDLGNIDGGGTYVTTLVYKATSKVENIEVPWDDSTFGASIIKHDYNDTKEEGIIYFNDRITKIGDKAFSSCDSLTSVTIPDSVTYIGYQAFVGCRYLTSVTIGNSVKTIGVQAFQGCRNLTSVTIPDSVTTIGDYTFTACISLTSVTIPDSVTRIYSSAFSGCISLTSVYCKAVTPPTGGSNMFGNNASGSKIYVPMQSVEAYKSASYWSDYADAIVGYHYNVGLFKTINGESIVGEGDISTSMVNTSWGRLVSSRDSGELIPGTYYRVIDYVTTTTQENTSSAGNPFDVIVLALDEHTLSEEAYAIQSQRDTDGYFANSNLAAWKLWYCLDNDTSRFAWADETSGTGVIYRMIDEFENDCPYDFKNILFTRYELEAPDEYSAQEDDYKWLEQLSKNVRAMFDEGVASYRWAGIELGNRYWEDEVGAIYSVATAKRKSFYTFSDITDYEDREVTADASLFSCYSNKMGDCDMLLPNNVFFGNNCYSNSLGDGCQHNSFCVNFFRNSFGNYCYNNNLGHNCYNNNLGHNCGYNNFTHDCYDNSLGNDCYYNSFGNACHSNSIGKDLYCNGFGNYCYYNSFSNGCYYNSFSNNCEYNSFGTGYNHSSLVGNLYKHNAFGDEVEYLHLLNDKQNQERYSVQNYRIASGTRGTYEEPLVINAERGRNYETTVARNSNGEIVQFCASDLADNEPKYYDGDVIQILSHTKTYVIDSPIEHLTIEAYNVVDNKVVEYKVHFVTANNVGGITLPSNTIWSNGEQPILQPNTYYELSIVKTHIAGVDYYKAVLTPFK